MDSQEPGTNQTPQPDKIGAQLGRRAARMFKTGKPRLKQAVEQNRPKAEQAGRDAVRYAQEHQDEIKSLALRGVRMRLGPLGMALDALGIGAGPQRGRQPADAAQGRVCNACQSANAANARFCNQCGARLEAQPEPGQESKPEETT